MGGENNLQYDSKCSILTPYDNPTLGNQQTLFSKKFTEFVYYKTDLDNLGVSSTICSALEKYIKDNNNQEIKPSHYAFEGKTTFIGEPWASAVLFKITNIDLYTTERFIYSLNSSTNVPSYLTWTKLSLSITPEYKLKFYSKQLTYISNEALPYGNNKYIGLYIDYNGCAVNDFAAGIDLDISKVEKAYRFRLVDLITGEVSVLNCTFTRE